MFTFTVLNDKQRCKSAKGNYTIGEDLSKYKLKIMNLNKKKHKRNF